LLRLRPEDHGELDRAFAEYYTVHGAACVRAADTVRALLDEQRNPRVAAPTAQAGALEPAPATVAAPYSLPTSIPLRFAPEWVPPQWAEYGRRAWADEGEAGAARTWSATPTLAQGELKGNRFELSYRRASGGLEGGTPVDINGRPGMVLWDEDKSTVEWLADADTVVSLRQWGNRIGETDLLRIARSVRPDPAVMTVPLHVSPVPAGYTPIGLEISGRSPGSWQALLYLSGPTFPTKRWPGNNRSGETPSV
jgi:hypothetical protein